MDDRDPDDPLAAMSAAGTKVPANRPWHDVMPNEIATEMLTRDGRFQIMVSFMRITPMATLVLDDTSRIIFMNAAAEHYWKVRVWDVRGKFLWDIMRLDEREKQGMRAEHANVLGSPGGRAQVFLEHFHNGSERLSMLKFPFAEDAGEQLIGCFVLPANATINQGASY